MTIGPAPRIRILWMSVRLGTSFSSVFALAGAAWARFGPRSPWVVEEAARPGKFHDLSKDRRARTSPAARLRPARSPAAPASAVGLLAPAHVDEVIVAIRPAVRTRLLLASGVLADLLRGRAV